MKIKAFLRKFKVVEIDVFVYAMFEYQEMESVIRNFKIQSEQTTKKGLIKYAIYKDNVLVHQSNLHQRVFLLKTINERGPVIGDCFTHPNFRGQSIYPNVLNYIAKDVLINKGEKKIFVVVNKQNTASIKGIEKAGFKKYASINAKRWLLWYFDKKIQLLN